MKDDNQTRVDGVMVGTGVGGVRIGVGEVTGEFVGKRVTTA